MTQHNLNLSLNQQGQDVALLQNRLASMGYAIAASEILNEVFGQSTFQAVLLFQQQEGLSRTGIVDGITAQTIVNRFEANKALTANAPHILLQPQMPQSSPVVAQGNGGSATTPHIAAPLIAMAASPISPNPTVPAHIAPALELNQPIGTVGAVSAVGDLHPINGGGGIEPPPVIHPGPPPPVVVPTPIGGPVIVPPVNVPINPPPVNVPQPVPTPAVTTNSVQGQIFLDHGMEATGLTVRLYNRQFGADTLLGEAKTDTQGQYTLPYNPGSTAANVEVRVVGADGKEVPLSATQYNADAQKALTLNLVAPATVQPLAAEFDRLSGDLKPHIGSAGNLGSAREDSDRQDISYLSQATGWDPRLVALAASASQASTTTNISQDTLYALFRAGLPTDTQQLAWVDAQAVQKALGKAHDVGIINFTDQQMTAANTAFTTFARTARLDATVPGTASKFGDFLSKSGLASQGTNGAANEQATFADLYFSHPTSGADLWQQAQAKGIAQAKIDALRLQGKMAYLTLNNADLAASLQQEIGSADALEQLVSKDLHKPESWQARLNTLAGNNEQNLQKLIPATFSSDTAANMLAAYSADLARKIRVNFPTQVVGRMLTNNEIQLGAGHDSPSVQTFLQKAAPLGYALGQTPVNSFIRDNQATLFAGATPDQIASTTESVKLLHRLYQVTPSNESLNVLLDHGFTSASDIATFPYDDFIGRYGSLFPSPDEARLVYRKAQQITVTTHSFFSAAQQLTFNPSIFVVSTSNERRQAAKNSLIEHYPTMNTLFGSLDFCTCDECRSVLSPAAYLVDLLQFLDIKPNVWASFLNYWKSQHGNVPYPFSDQAAFTTFLNNWHTTHPGAPDPDTQKTPYTVLTERRPDLPFLPLTCENTNTAMPYIDIVNEILEYYIVHGNLSSSAVYNTGNATTPELLAEPQNILPAAYDTLKQAHYPLSLPFDLWLATVRSFFNYYQTPFWKVLDMFRPSDELFAPQTNPASYYRAAIFAEYLGITPSEYALFTNATPLVNWFTLYAYQSENDALTALKSAKTLSQRLGVSYTDLISLVRTGFVNPQLNTLGLLYKLGIEVETVFRYKGQPGYQPFSVDEKTAFENQLDALSTTFASTGFDARGWLDSAWQAGNFNTILVFFDTDPAGNFDQTTLQFANGTAADNLSFLKLNVFVRLWKRLGWSIEETDRTLQAFLPLNSLPLTAATIDTAFTTALLYMAHLNTLLEQCKPAQQNRLQLLSLWTDIATTGTHPLYAKLFLTKSVLQNDLIFDHPLGLYLTYFDTAKKQNLPFTWDSSKPEDAKAGNVSLQNHLSAVQGALGLSADDIGLILTDVGKKVETEALTLATLSLLYRYGLLAKALGLTVRDLITLKALSGLNPFAPLNANPVTQLADDVPLTQMLGFVEMVNAVHTSGYSVEDINYLLRHRFDAVGKYRPDPNATLTLVKTLASGVRGIQNDTLVPTSASVLTDDFLHQKLALVLPASVVDTFFTMWTGTITCIASQSNVLPVNQLTTADIAGEPEIQISYETVQQTQQLTFQGVLFDARKTQMTTDHNLPLLASLLNQVEAQAQTFFATYLQPFLTAALFEQLFTPLASGLSDVDRQTQMQARRVQFAQAFLPYLRQKLVNAFVVQTMATSLSADPILVADLLTDTTLLSDPTNPPAQNQPANALLSAFIASADTGVSSTSTNTNVNVGPGGSPPHQGTDAPVAPGGTGNPPAAFGFLNTTHFEGYFEVPTNGAYRFFMELDGIDSTTTSVNASLRLPDLPNFALDAISANNTLEGDQFTNLKAGIPYSFTLDVHYRSKIAIQAPGANEASFPLLVQGENLPKGSFDRLILYTQAAVERVTRAQVLLAKTLQIIQTSGLSEGEVRYLLTHAADFANLNLSNLPTRAEDDTLVGATALFAQFLRLAAYTSLKNDLAANTDDLVDLFAHARQSYPLQNPAQTPAALFDDLCQRMADMTRRNVAVVKATANALGFTTNTTNTATQITITAPDFTQEQGLQRLWKALQMIGTLGVSMDALQRWLTPAPDFSVAHDLRNTLKAQYEAEAWQRIAQPIFDVLRKQQRDALVAYIMQQQGFTLPEQLFEYFLIDPGMEPVVQTSRLRLAISSLQLFIQRCLLNLEQEVHPTAINSQQWQWMKRYRVWEANRKIFLFPENWLEPEFRDDKTNLFLDLESTLLQGDISNDFAEDAFFNYLKSLEVLARLDIVSMYAEEMPDPADNKLHVIGRTHGSPHKYFYRTFAHQMWTPWTPVTTDIDGDHIVAVVWRQRLHLFWATFMEKAVQDTSNASQSFQDIGKNSISSSAPQKQVDVQLSWSEYFQGQWTPRQTSGFGNLSSPYSGTFDSSSVFISVSIEFVPNADGTSGEGSVNISLSSPINQTFKIMSKNSLPQVSNTSTGPYEPYSYNGVDATQLTGTGELDISYVESIEFSSTSQEARTSNKKKAILNQGDSYTLLFSSNQPQFTGVNGRISDSGTRALDWFDSQFVIDILTRPFFYQDSQNTFFVEPTMTETKIDTWEWWVIQYPWPYLHLNNDAWWSNLTLQAAVPIALRPLPIASITPIALHPFKPVNDWAIDPATVLSYGNSFVGREGGLTPVGDVARNGLTGTGVQFRPVVPIATTAGTGRVLNIANDGSGISGIRNSGTLSLVGASGLTRESLANLQLAQHLNGNRFVLQP